MLSDIKKLVIDKTSIELVKGDTEFMFYGDIEKLIENQSGTLKMYDDYDTETPMIVLEAIIVDNYLIVTLDDEIVLKQFFPKDMIRNIQKDFRKERPFDIEYRKHLISDFSRDNYKMIIPKPISEEVKNRAVEKLKSMSEGKYKMPIGVVLEDQIVVLKGDNVLIEKI